MLRDQPFMRDDTFLGVCQSLGEDFRIPPNLLRLAMAPVLVWNPLATLGIYTLVAIVIAVTHWIFPNPVRVAEPATASGPAVEVHARAADQEESGVLAGLAQAA